MALEELEAWNAMVGFLRFRKETEARWRRRVTEAVLADLEGAYGGEGWNDPRLVPVTENWISWPMYGQQEINIEVTVQEMLDQSFDPRDLVEHYRP